MIIIKYEGNKIIHDEEKDLVLYIINDTHLKSSENEKYNFKILKRDNNYYCCVSDEYKSYQFNNVKYDKMIELNLSKHNKLVLDFNFWDYLQFTIKELQGYHFGS